MELLQQTYGSDSDSDVPADEALPGPLPHEQHMDSTRALPLHMPPASWQTAHPLPPPELHPWHYHQRLAIADQDARRLVEHVQRHRMTREEQAFAFQGYVSKRRRRSADPVRLTSSQPRTSNDAISARSQLFDAASDTNHLDDDNAATDDSDNGIDKRQARVHKSLLPTRAVRAFKGHTAAVNCARWNETKHPSLFLTASMDGSVRIWHYKQPTSRRALTSHTRGVKSARWSLDGLRVFSGGYDGKAIWSDAETGEAIQMFEPLASSVSDQHTSSTSSRTGAVTSVCVHPSDGNLVLAGTDRGVIMSYDVRQRVPCRTFKRGFGDVLDLLFLPDNAATGSAQFVSSAGVRTRDASHQTLLVWDFASATLLSDRLDRDMQPFQCLRMHPREPRFVAQASADYALFFAATAPYKRSNKGRSRFAGGHEVQGYSVQCSFSADGAVLATGDANGRVFLYDTTTKRVLRRIDAFSTDSVSRRASACLSAEFQPAALGHDASSTERARLVASSFDGRLELFEGCDSAG